MSGPGPVELVQGPLCGEIVDGTDWECFHEKSFRISWSEFQYDSETPATKVNQLRQDGQNIRGVCSYRRENEFKANWVVEK